jgi:signal transduction histidine kinase
MGDAAKRSVRVTVTGDGRRARMEVRDTGPGLPTGLGDLIFEAYVRGAGESQPGIGLGLATVKRLVVAHHGSVQARSEPGGGATFVVELPLARSRVEEPLLSAPVPAAPWSSAPRG